jgi:hypothetical protein
MNVPLNYGPFAHKLLMQGDAEPMFVTGALKLIDTDQVAVQAVCQALHDFFRQLVIGACGGTMQTTGTELKIKIGEPDVYRQAVVFGVQSGGLSGNNLPSNSAYLVRKETGLGGKTNAGRFFLPGVPVVIVNQNGDIPQENVNGVQTALNTYFNGVTTQLNVAEYALLHGSRANGTIPGGPPTKVTSLQVQNKIATQRQRMRR